MQLPLLGHTMTSLTKFLTFALLLQQQAKYRQRRKPSDNVVIIYLTISELQPVSVGHQKSRLDRRRRNSRVGGALHYAKQEHGTYIRMGGGKLQQVISITAGDHCKQDQDHLYPPAAENAVCVHLANQCTLRSAVHTKSSRKQNTTQRSGDVSVVISSSYLDHHHITPVSTHAVCQSSHRP
jgi:hypothetical protein